MMRDAIFGVVEFGWPTAMLRTAVDYPQAWQEMAEQPQICITDLAMPGSLPREGIKRMKAISPATAILVVTGNEDDRLLLDLYAMGIAGFVPKSSRTAVIEAAIQIVLAGERYLPARVLQLASVAGQTAEQPTSPDLANGRLSHRQQQILQMVATGESSKEIARKLDLSPSTVKAHTAAAMAALGASNRTEAVAKALRFGIITN